MNLDQLQKYYCENLENRVFRFQLPNRVVDVIFYREMLCHLLGIQHIYTAFFIFAQAGTIPVSPRAPALPSAWLRTGIPR